MTKFLINKFFKGASVLAAVSVLAYLLVSLSPIDPVDAYIGADIMQISAEQRDLIAARWGLDQPPIARYLSWLSQILQLNLGRSLIYDQPVAEVIAVRFAASFALLFTAWVFSGVIGFVLGVVAAAWRDSVVDQAIRFYAYTLASTPTFWFGMVLLIVFAVGLRVAPICCATPPGTLPDEVTIWQRIQHLILPAATLSIIGVAPIALHTRQKLIDVLHSDYALFARAQGETTIGLIRQHGLRNIALPAVTLQFGSLSELFGGAILAEQVFTYPGLGQATIEAGLRGDVPLLLGITLFSAAFVFTGNTIADLIYRIIDPRIRSNAHAA